MKHVTTAWAVRVTAVYDNFTEGPLFVSTATKFPFRVKLYSTRKIARAFARKVREGNPNAKVTAASVKVRVTVEEV